MESYTALIKAVRILDDAQYAIWLDESTSPAWRVVINARDHVKRQAEAVIREAAPKAA